MWGNLGQILPNADLPLAPDPSNINQKYGPSILDGVLFVLHPIHTKMIAWFKEAFGFGRLMVKQDVDKFGADLA